MMLIRLSLELRQLTVAGRHRPATGRLISTAAAAVDNVVRCDRAQLMSVVRFSELLIVDNRRVDCRSQIQRQFIGVMPEVIHLALNTAHTDSKTAATHHRF